MISITAPMGTTFVIWWQNWRRSLTVTTQKLLSYIYWFKLQNNGDNPDYAEIQAGLDYASHSSIRWLFEQLEGEGHVTRRGETFRRYNFLPGRWLPPSSDRKDADEALGLAIKGATLDNLPEEAKILFFQIASCLMDDEAYHIWLKALSAQK